MKILLDTHFAVWAALERHRLKVSERLLLEDRASDLVLSAVSVWELGLKWRSRTARGERKGPADPGSVLLMADRLRWSLLPLTPRHASAELKHPIGHKDPFDELLLVQAQEEGMRLLTRDGELAGHPLALAMT